MSNRGQGLIETVLSLPIFIIFVVAIGILSYRAVIFHTVDYHLHEAMICHESESKNVCEKELRQRLGKILGSTAKTQVRLSRGYKSHYGEVIVDVGAESRLMRLGLSSLNPQLRFEKTLAR